MGIRTRTTREGKVFSHIIPTIEFDRKIGDIYVPTLMIYGLNDAAIAEKGVDETEKYIKAPYTLKKLNVSHWIMQESFEEVSVFILNHLQN